MNDAATDHEPMQTSSNIPRPTLRKLRRADWNRLWLQGLVWARRQAGSYPWLPRMEREIVQTAIEKTFSGERRWDPEACDLSHHLRMTIRSLYHSEVKKLRNRQDHARRELAVSSDRSGAAQQAQERLDDLRAMLRLLRQVEPELAEFFLTASRHFLAGCDTDAEVAAAMGLSPSQFSKRKARIAAIASDPAAGQAIRGSRT